VETVGSNLIDEVIGIAKGGTCLVSGEDKGGE